MQAPSLTPVYQVDRYAGQVLSMKGAQKVLLVDRRTMDERERIMLELGI